jgi:tRNA(fMet)-specific endonuclease VapC
VGFLIDSTVFVFAEKQQLAPDRLIAAIGERFGDVELAVSVMTAGELRHGCWRADTPARRARREEFVEAVLGTVPVIPVSLPIMRVYAEVDARLSRKGERLPVSDLVIGSTALAGGHGVITGNPRHFERIPGLKVKRFP